MKLHEHFRLKDILFYKIGGTADIVLEAKSHRDIIEAFEYIKNHNIKKFLVVGLGANLIMPDDNFDGAIIWINRSTSPYIKMTEERLVEVYAGQTLDELIQFTFSHNLRGLEALGGLPSTVGGAIRGNAGAFGVEMEDVVEKVEVLETVSGEIRLYDKDECEFSYRNSYFKQHHNFIILRGFFKLPKATDEEVSTARKVYQEAVAYRETHHPIEYPSCGSVFKNAREQKEVEKILAVWPDIENLVREKWHGKVSMGYAIKRLGFSGMQIGGARVTEKHANYISNVANATYQDVTTIIDTIKKEFYDTFGFYPEVEAEIVK